MPRLTHNSYGKSRVRVSKIKRPRQAPAGEERHEFIEATVDVLLEGEFAAAYTSGDNRSVVATDTCKNTVYVLAKDDPFESIESFGRTVAEHFLKHYAHVEQATIDLKERRWLRLLDCPHAFLGDSNETPTAQVVARRGTPTTIRAGLEGLTLAKTTQTGFANFHRDEFRTLPDTEDRIFATQLTATWDYAKPDVDFVACRGTIRQALLARFIDHYSQSVQETLYRMGAGALEACQEITRVSLAMPNKHHLLFNLAPFSRKNENEIFISTDEPHGYITGVVER